MFTWDLDQERPCLCSGNAVDPELPVTDDSRLQVGFPPETMVRSNVTGKKEKRHMVKFIGSNALIHGPSLMDRIVFFFFFFMMTAINWCSSDYSCPLWILKGQ
jgi:hypothetical protein